MQTLTFHALPETPPHREPRTVERDGQTLTEDVYETCAVKRIGSDEMIQAIWIQKLQGFFVPYEAKPLANVTEWAILPKTQAGETIRFPRPQI